MFFYLYILPDDLLSIYLTSLQGRQVQGCLVLYPKLDFWIFLYFLIFKLIFESFYKFWKYLGGKMQILRQFSRADFLKFCHSIKWVVTCTFLLQNNMEENVRINYVSTLKNDDIFNTMNHNIWFSVYRWISVMSPLKRGSTTNAQWSIFNDSMVVIPWLNWLLVNDQYL